MSSGDDYLGPEFEDLDDTLQQGAHFLGILSWKLNEGMALGCSVYMVAGCAGVAVGAKAQRQGKQSDLLRYSMVSCCAQHEWICSAAFHCSHSCIFTPHLSLI